MPGSSGGLHVTLFGVPALVFEGRPVTLRAPPRTLPLFVSLLLDQRPSSDGRVRLAERLWPHAGPEEARTNLRRHLSYLRKALAAIGIAAPDLGDLSLGAGVVAWSDVWEFERLAGDAAGAAAAFDLYGGPLLEPYDGEEWIAAYRFRYQREYIDLATRLVHAEWLAGRTAAALAVAARALAVEPLAEDLVQAALRLSLESGDANAGIVLYDRFAARLREAYDESPDQQTFDLRERLRRAPHVAVPHARDAFVGREDDLRALRAHVQTRHCIALEGPPGIGKSRLAAALARAEADRFLDGVFWVDAAGAADAAALEAQTLRLVGPGDGAPGSLADRVAGRSLLVVFDRCEAVREAVREVAARVLPRAAGLRLIVTSTKRVAISGSLEWTVEPLRSADAVALFEDRAAAAEPRAARERERERDVVAAICAALDGVPLAIELAAQRVRTRSLHAILAEVHESVAPALDGALGRAVALLRPDERRCFIELSTLGGAFSLAAAAATANRSERETLALLDELVASSLVSLAAIEPEPRYELLAPVRAFAQRSREPADAERAAERVAQYFARRIVELDRSLRGGSAFEWYPVVEADYAGIRAALEWMLASSEHAPLGARMCLALSRFWYDRGFLADGLACVRRALEAVPATDEHRLLRAETRWIFDWLRRNGGEFAQTHRELVRSCDELAAAGAPEALVANAELLCANAARMVGRFDEARERAQRALATYERRAERYNVGYALLGCGVIELSAGDVARARVALVASLAAYEETGATADAALALLNLAECAIADGEVDLAEAMASEAARRCVESGNLYFLAHANQTLACVHEMRRDHAAAARILHGVLRSARDFGDRELITLCAESAARCAFAAAHAATAALLLGAADAERARIAAARPVVHAERHAAFARAVTSRIGDDAAEHARSIGAALGARDLPARVEAALRDATRMLAARRGKAATRAAALR